MREKIKVLLTLDSYFPVVDGVINCLHNYAKNYGDDVEVTCVVPYMGKYIDIDPFEVVRCKSMYLNKFYRWARPFQDKKMLNYIEQKKFDIVHTHSPFVMSKFGIYIARKQNIPIVSTFHTDFRTIFKNSLKIDAFAQLVVNRFGKVYNQMDEVFVCSPAVEKQARSYGYKGKISYLPFGTELEKCDNVEQLQIEANLKYNLSKDDNIFIYIGRLTKLKRIDVILQALKVVKDAGYNFKFYIVGKGIDEKSIKACAKKLRFTEENVIFTQFLPREDMPRLIARSNMLLFPSLYDNFALVRLEAAAYSCPSVVVKNSSTAYGLLDGENSLLIDDNVQSFADKIIWGINNKQELKRIGENAKNQIHLSWKDAAKDVVDAYYRIINEFKNK